MLHHIYSPVKGNLSFCLLVLTFISLACPSASHAQINLVDFIYSGKGSTFLNSPAAMVTSEDGAFVYVLSKKSSAIAIFSRDLESGELTFLAAEAGNNADESSSRLKGGSDMILSSDGLQLYVAAASDASISVYNRNGTTGLLTFTASHKNNSGNIKGLEEVSSLVLTPNEKFLYAAGAGEDAIVIFIRDREDGSLTYATTKYNEKSGIEGLKYPMDLTLNPVSNYLYATCFSGNSIVVFEYDPYSTSLTYKATYYNGEEGIQGLEGAMTSTITPDGAYLYTVGKFDSRVSLFMPSAINHELDYVGVPDEITSAAGDLNEATYITTVNEGNNILISNSGNNSLWLFSRNDDNGELVFMSTFENGVDGVAGLEYAYAICESPDLKNVYVGGYEEGAVAIFDQDINAADFTFHSAVKEVVDVQKMDGTSSVAVSPDVQHVYSVSMEDNNLVVFDRNSENGMLTFKANLSNGDHNVSGIKGAKSVKVSPDGNNVYVTGFIDNALAVFTRNQSTGLLTFHSKIGESEAEGLRGPCDLLVSGDGRFVYVSAFWEGALFVFSRNTNNGGLSFVEKIAAAADNALEDMVFLTALAFSSDQNELYATSYHDHTLHVFKRNNSTGKLTFWAKHKNGNGEVRGLGGACAIAVSPDGGRVIVAGKKDNGFAVFVRNSNTGALVFESVVGGNIEGNILRGIVALQFSLDGSALYGTSITDDYLFKYAYDSSNGSFTEGEILVDDESGINGLDGAMSLSLTSDGRFIYVGSYQDDAIVVIRN